VNFLAIKKDQTKFDIVLWILIFSVVFVVHEPRILKFFFTVVYISLSVHCAKDRQ